LCTICGGEEKVRQFPGPLAAAYSMLMFQRNQCLSAWQRLMTILAIRGHAEDMVRTSHIGVLWFGCLSFGFKCYIVVF